MIPQVEQKLPKSNPFRNSNIAIFVKHLKANAQRKLALAECGVSCHKTYDMDNAFDTKVVSIKHTSSNLSISYDLDVLQFSSDPMFFKSIKVLYADDAKGI